MTNQNLFEAVALITGHLLLESEIFEILDAVKADREEFMKSQQEEVFPLPDIDTVVGMVAKLYDTDPGLLRIRTRKREIVEPRQLCFAVLMLGLQLSSSNTGAEMGGFDHATVLYGIGKVSERYQTYKHFRESVDGMLTELFPNSKYRKYVTDRIIDPRTWNNDLLPKMPVFFTEVA